MSGAESSTFPDAEAPQLDANPQQSEDLHEQVRQLRSQLTSEAMQRLADPQEQEFLQAVEQDQANAHTAFQELRSELEALDTIEERFSGIDGYENFEHFLSSGELSHNEIESFLEAA